GMPAHAVVDLAVETARRDQGTRRFAKLVNAVLRRVAERGQELLRRQDGTRCNIPDWLWQRWSATYGLETARHIAAASLGEAAVDLSVKPGGDSPARWAERLGGGGPGHRPGPPPPPPRPPGSGRPPRGAPRGRGGPPAARC